MVPQTCTVTRLFRRNQTKRSYEGTNAMTANTMIDLTDFLGQQLAQAGRYLLRQMV